MALSKQLTPVRNLVIFKKYAKSRGARITEALPEDRVDPVHVKGSWHYDEQTHAGVKHSLACDVNFGAPGTSAAEREVLAHLVVVAQSLGLAVRYALYGAVAGHSTHLHVDVGSWTNLGKGERKPIPGDPCVWDTQHPIHAAVDNLAGNETKRRLFALREASRFGGEDFPYGVEFTQDVVGTKEDGSWKTKSRAAHDVTVEGVQSVWKRYGLYDGQIDHIWGPKMDAAWRRFLDLYGR